MVGCAPTRNRRLIWRPPTRPPTGTRSPRIASSPGIGGDFSYVSADKVQYIDISPKQMVGVSAGLIPFLEHDDANRALMGSNMQRQAVPLLVTEPPLVSTGLEKDVARNSGMVVKAERAGTITYVDGERIKVDEREYTLRKFVGLNERTCLNQKPIVKMGQKVKKGADHRRRRRHLPGRAGAGPQRAGRVHVVGRLQLRGRDHHQRKAGEGRHLHLDPHRGVRDRNPRDQAGQARSSPATSPTSRRKALANLDDNGIVRIGTFVVPGDILVGKVSPKSKSELTPEEKLLHAIFGRAGEDVKNDSLEVPSGVEGIVIHSERFSRRASMTEEERKDFDKEHKDIETGFNDKIVAQFKSLCNELGTVLDKREIKGLGIDREDKSILETVGQLKFDHLDIRSPEHVKPAKEIFSKHHEAHSLLARRKGAQAQFAEARRRAANPACSRWSRSTWPPNGRSRSATRWPAGTATRA